MAKISTFKAVRPTRDKVSLIAARPYESYTSEEISSRLRDNPYSFLHIVNPGYKYNLKNTSEKERYTLVRNRYLEFKEEGYFIQDKIPSLYVYRIIDNDGHVTEGIIAAINVEEYKKNIIKKHEATLDKKESILKEYTHIVGFNPEPVLLVYSDSNRGELEILIAQTTNKRAEYEFTTTFKDTHYLWCIEDSEVIHNIKKEFMKVDSLYIADGHHRIASLLELHNIKNDLNENNAIEKSYDYFMSYLIPESNLRIYGFNRLVKDLNGLKSEEFLTKLDSIFKIEKKGLTYFKPNKKGVFSMYLNGQFYSLILRKSESEFMNISEELDANILFNTVLSPILGIENMNNDSRIHYVHGKNDMSYVQSIIDKGLFKVGFGLLPVTFRKIKEIANQNLTMPPKTTYIEPKLRNGITIYEY